MEQRIKEIVAEYINVPAGEISDDTVIDRTSVPSSIVLHRLYAKLADEGFRVNDYWNIKTFGTLLNQNNISASTVSTNNGSQVLYQPTSNAIVENDGAVGIDIEEVSAMPLTDDFREDSFYTMNFSAQEIAYCILQPSPYASFCGLFAAKEALVKADNRFKNYPFNTIVITHTEAGKPAFAGYQLSVSHTGVLAVAVAIKQTLAGATTAPLGNELTAANKPSNLSAFKLLAVAGFVIAVIALLLTIGTKL